jgi:hypothetical protein
MLSLVQQVSAQGYLTVYAAVRKGVVQVFKSGHGSAFHNAILGSRIRRSPFPLLAGLPGRDNGTGSCQEPDSRSAPDATLAGIRRKQKPTSRRLVRCFSTRRVRIFQIRTLLLALSIPRYLLETQSNPAVRAVTIYDMLCTTNHKLLFI